MKDTEFAALAQRTLQQIEMALERCSTALDLELTGDGILEVTLPDDAVIVINRHAVAQEIWVAARSGAFHFRHDGHTWRDTRSTATLAEVICQMLRPHVGEVTLSGLG